METIPEFPVIDQLSLWPHQLEAVQRMRHYFARRSSKQIKGSALVHMPTGSGKTGVIATLARCLPEVGCTLILVPRVALRQQLFRDVQKGFFKRLAPNLPLDSIPKTVIELCGDGLMQEIKDYGATVLVATIHKIRNLAEDADPEWEKLTAHVSLVIVDEGHYEPASSWSQVLRSFDAPKIIFTATPYRNDTNLFDINLEHVFSYTFHQAVQDGFLRTVEFVPRKPTRDPGKFVADLLAFLEEKFPQAARDEVRVIIRCEKQEHMDRIASALNKNACDYVLIHENYSDSGEDPRKRKSVPDPRSITARFWVHQFKLMEGIDDERFQVLALFDPLQNARSLVQQIGRVIRNPHRVAEAKGYVLDHSSESRQQQLWTGYLKYDQALVQHGEKALNLAIGKDWLAGLFEIQPICSYMDEKFRVPLDLDALDPQQDLVLPRMVNLRSKGENFEWEKFCGALENKFINGEGQYRRFDEEHLIIFLHISFHRSPLLENMYFLEPRLGVTIAKEIGEVVAYYDSSGQLPLDDTETGLGNVVNSYDLKKLFSNISASRLTGVSLKNANLAPNAIRSHSIYAQSIQNTVAGFDDHSQICATATGYTLEKTNHPVNTKLLRRYIGFGNGRVSQSSKPCSLHDYEKWIRDVVRITNQTISPLSTFHRYAVEHPVPGDPTPKHILLDLQKVAENYLNKNNGSELRIEDSACDVTLDPDRADHAQSQYHFTIMANEQPYKVFIRYDQQKEKYFLESHEFDKAFNPKEDAEDPRSPITYLNQEQSFRVIPATVNYIYTLGKFYQPMFKVGPGFDPNQFDVCQVLIPSSKLGTVTEEKIEKLKDSPRGIPWSENTLFGIIRNLGKGSGLEKFFEDPDIMVCDDMGTESADFILADTKKRKVIFIHAKASSSRRPCSASALQEVIGQATKNINFLGMYNESIPPNLDRWDEAWPSPGNPLIKKRILLGKGDGEMIWEKIQTVIRHPLADREVWLFLGNTLSKDRFEKYLGGDPASPESVQAAHLLRSALTCAASVGAKLRVFCYP